MGWGECVGGRYSSHPFSREWVAPSPPETVVQHWQALLHWRAAARRGVAGRRAEGGTLRRQVDDHLRTSDESIWAVGDAVEVAPAATAAAAAAGTGPRSRIGP